MTIKKIVDEQGLRHTDWAAYDGCPTCLVDAGRVCRHLVSRRGEQGLGHNGMRPLTNPHPDRPLNEQP